MNRAGRGTFVEVANHGLSYVRPQSLHIFRVSEDRLSKRARQETSFGVIRHDEGDLFHP